MYILEGLFIGLSTLILVGPVVFILINATINNGIKNGFSVAVGIFISDLIYLLITLKGIDLIENNQFLNTYLSLIGFVLLFSFGLIYFFKKDLKPSLTNTKKTIITDFLKGFSINFFNPFVFSFWVLISKYGSNKYPNNIIYFLIAILLGILIIDFVKVFLAKKLNYFLNSNKIILFYKFSGVLMLLFSLRILCFFIYK